MAQETNVTTATAQELDPKSQNLALRASGIPDAAQTMTQRGATVAGFDRQQELNKVMDMWGNYIKNVDFTTDPQPQITEMQQKAASYGAMNPDTSNPQYDAQITGGIPTAIPDSAPKGLWSPAMLEKYPELASVTDPNLIKEIADLPKLSWADMVHEYNWKSKKDTPQNNYGNWLKGFMSDQGLAPGGKLAMPTTQEAIDKYKWASEMSYRGARTILNNDDVYNMSRGGPANMQKEYVPWKESAFMTDGRFDIDKYRKSLDYGELSRNGSKYSQYVVPETNDPNLAAGGN